MEIVLNRKGGVPVRDQLVAQLELRILAGDFAPGERLPSVRSLGRRLRLHANTISAAYRRLEASGHVEMRRGAGVFVREAGATTLESARSLDEMIQVALLAGRRKGYSAAEIRAAVKHWLDAPPPSKLVAADKSRSMAELLAAEARAVSPLPVEALDLQAVAADPGRLEGALTVSLPYHLAALRRAAPRAVVLTVTLEVGPGTRKAIRDVATGGLLLVVSHSEAVLPFADKLVRSLRGDDLLVETRLLRDRTWRRLLPAADLVFVDALSAEAVSRNRPRGVLAFRVLGDSALARVARAARVALATTAEAGSSGRAAVRAEDVQ